MAVNVNKTKYIIFKPKGVKINIGDDEGIIYDENEIGQPIDPNKKKNLTESIPIALTCKIGLINY